MTSSSPERETANYVEALLMVEETVWAECEEIAERCQLSTNDIIAIAITDLHSRMINIREGRVLISVDAADTRFYTSALEMHLGEADPAYARALERLAGAPTRSQDQD